MTTPPSAGNDPSASDPARRRRLAIVSLVTGLCGLVAIGLAVALTALGSPFSADEKPGHPEGMVPVSALRPGDCLSGYTEEYSEPVAVRLPCDRRHNGEVVARATLRPGPFQQLRGNATDLCKERSEFLTNRPTAADLELRIALPDEDEWQDGDREIMCVLVYTGQGSFIGSLAESLKTRPTRMAELDPGDCVKRWDRYTGKQPVIGCTEEHGAQLYAIFTLKGKKYPGDRTLRDDAGTRCLVRGLKVLVKRLPKRLEWRYVSPSKETWAQGNRLLYCFVESKGEPLTRSLMTT